MRIFISFVVVCGLLTSGCQKEEQTAAVETTAVEAVAAEDVVVIEELSAQIDDVVNSETQDNVIEQAVAIGDASFKQLVAEVAIPEVAMPEVAIPEVAIPEVAIPAVAVPEAAVAVSAIIVISNNKANVTLTHAVHGEKYGCQSCHGDVIPGPFELGKSKAHTMCKGCHKVQNGPTKCSGCHVK